jgi:hypothetical protein
MVQTAVYHTVLRTLFSLSTFREQKTMRRAVNHVDVRTVLNCNSKIGFT